MHLVHRRYSVVGLAAVVLVLAACGDASISATDPGAREEFTVSVVIAPVRFAQQSTRFDAVGTGRAQQAVSLFPEVTGEVVERGFAAGDKVTAGDVLLRLEDRDETLAVELAQVRLRDAQRLLERYRNADGNAAILPTTVDTADTAVDTARIELARARVALDRRRVIAPFGGYVGISDVEVGDRIGPQTVVTTLDNRDALLIRLAVPEALSGQLRAGDALQVAPWGSAQLTRAATVVDLDSRIDPAARTFTIQARIDNADDALRPGMSFRVSLEILGGTFPVVPEVAVQWGANGAYIWRAVDNRAQQVSVGIVERRAGEILVDAPLAPGERIVVEGVQRVRDGVLLRDVGAKGEA